MTNEGEPAAAAAHDAAPSPRRGFDPAKVGAVRNYPATEAEHEARCAHLAVFREQARADGTLTRRGVPNGWAGRRPQLEVIRRNAMTEAERLTEALDLSDATDEELAEEMLREAAAIALDHTQPRPVRLMASRLFLDFVVPKPLHPKGAGAALGVFEALAACASQSKSVA